MSVLISICVLGISIAGLAGYFPTIEKSYFTGLLSGVIGLWVPQPTFVPNEPRPKKMEAVSLDDVTV